MFNAQSVASDLRLFFAAHFAGGVFLSFFFHSTFEGFEASFEFLLVVLFVGF